MVNGWCVGTLPPSHPLLQTEISSIFGKFCNSSGRQFYLSTAWEIMFSYFVIYFSYWMNKLYSTRASGVWLKHYFKTLNSPTWKCLWSLSMIHYVLNKLWTFQSSPSALEKFKLHSDLQNVITQHIYCLFMLQNIISHGPSLQNLVWNVWSSQKGQNCLNLQGVIFKALKQARMFRS